MKVLWEGVLALHPFAPVGHKTVRRTAGVPTGRIWVPRTTPTGMVSAVTIENSLILLWRECQMSFGKCGASLAVSTACMACILCSRRPGGTVAGRNHLHRNLRRQQNFQASLEGPFDQLVQRAAAAGADQHL